MAMLLNNNTVVFAKTEDGSVGTTYDSRATHSHPVCGSSCKCSSITHENKTWTAWDGTRAMTKGYYYLTEDIELDSTVVLDYSYTSQLCLNGHTITCDNVVFNIYSYRTLIITDCVGTGKVESTDGYCTISNNKLLTVWAGTILNSGGSDAIFAYNGTNTYINGGTIEADGGCAIYAFQGSKIQVKDGTLRGGGSSPAIIGQDDDTDVMSGLTISGGTFISDTGYEVLDIQSGNFTMTGGYVDGNAHCYDEEGTTTISGGAINGEFADYSGSANISGGKMMLNLSGTESTISAGTFIGTCYIAAGNNTISGGDFTKCNMVGIRGTTWINGGSFGLAQVENKMLYLSGVPEIDTLQLGYPDKVSAQNPDGTGSFGGDMIKIRLDHPYSGTVWKDGDIVIKNVKSDAVAEKFLLTGEDAEWRYLERVNNNLVLRIIPHGTWGNNVTWRIDGDTLIISGEGKISSTYSGDNYPWGKYSDQITKVIVEPGITEIPAYAFEYLRKATSISIPETVTSLSLYAFNECESLNNLIIPSSVTYLNGRIEGQYIKFFRCDSLTDVYYFGTVQEWNSIENAEFINLVNGDVNIHFLVKIDGTATCTQPGKEPYYQYDDTSVYNEMYDLDKNVITKLTEVPALGHTGGTATCGRKAVCDRCKESYGSFDVSNHTGGTTIENAKEASCKEPGYSGDEICLGCKNVVKAGEEIPQKIHEYNQSIVDEKYEVSKATCKSKAVYKKSCICGEAGEETFECGSFDVSNHTGGTKIENAKETSCKEPGYSGDEICLGCQNVVKEGEEIPQKTHAWDDGVITTPATAAKPGEMLYTCTACGEEETKSVEYEGVIVERIWGDSRYKTSISIADKLKEKLDLDKFETVIIASGQNFPDALAGSYLAAKKNAPILMVNSKVGNMELVQSYVEQNLVTEGNVYILGGNAAVPEAVETNLIENGYEVVRLMGENRYETNVAILEEAGVTNERILVCTGKDFADSLSASATGAPIFLVNPKTNSLTVEQEKFLKDKQSQIYIIGGDNAVSEVYEEILANYDVDKTIERVAGDNRYETSVKVAETFCTDPEKAVIAYAKNFPDGLCGGPLAFFEKAPLILTAGDKEMEAKNYVSDNHILKGTVLGGVGVLSDHTVREVFGMADNELILGTEQE